MGAAILLTIAAYLTLYLVAAMLPVIGLAVIVWPKTLGKVGMFVAGTVVSAVVFAAGTVIVTKIAAVVLMNTNPMFGAVIVALVGWILWKALRGSPMSW